MRIPIALPVLLLATAAPAATVAQEPSVPASSVPAAPAADPADVASPEAIVAALYDVISGDAGEVRDWDRFRSLLHPTARLTPASVDGEGKGVVRPVTADEYIARNEPWLLEHGFHEREIARRAERFGRVMHVWSTYESLNSLSDAAHFARGINSIQLFDDGERWWILSVYWQAERPEWPLPVEYLP